MHLHTHCAITVAESALEFEGQWSNAIDLMCGEPIEKPKRVRQDPETSADAQRNHRDHPVTPYDLANKRRNNEHYDERATHGPKVWDGQHNRPGIEVDNGSKPCLAMVPYRESQHNIAPKVNKQRAASRDELEVARQNHRPWRLVRRHWGVLRDILESFDALIEAPLERDAIEAASDSKAIVIRRRAQESGMSYREQDARQYYLRVRPLQWIIGFLEDMRTDLTTLIELPPRRQALEVLRKDDVPSGGTQKAREVTEDVSDSESESSESSADLDWSDSDPGTDFLDFLAQVIGDFEGCLRAIKRAEALDFIRGPCFCGSSYDSDNRTRV